MRLDSYSFRTHLITALESPLSGARIEVDECDVLRVRLRSDQLVEIHLIERLAETDEITTIFNRNRKINVHTLYLMLCDMILPDHDQIFEPDPWLLTLHTIYSGKIYAYKVYGDQSYIYPIHLEKMSGDKRLVHYQAAIKIAHLGCAVNRITSETMAGEWLIADFNNTAQRSYHTTDDRNHRIAPPAHTLQLYFDRLGVEIGADWNTIKKAYRHLARQYHPDLNASPEANRRMQQINEAYRHLMNLFGE